jgi:hypothetical protein
MIKLWEGVHDVPGSSIIGRVFEYLLDRLWWLIRCDVARANAAARGCGELFGIITYIGLYDYGAQNSVE